jgi:FdhD protein
VKRTVSIHRFESGIEHWTTDSVAVEEPLEIRLRYQADSRWKTQAVAITMRTPGQDRELAAGFLFSESIFDSGRDIELMETSGAEENELTVELRSGVDVDWERLKRNFYTTSSCGVCGKASLEALAIEDEEPLRAEFEIEPAVLESLPALLRKAQTTFAATGGLHAAGLFSAGGELLGVYEDVGRHNAADKLVGHFVLRGEGDLSRGILALSGRASFELLQKAWRARIGVVAAVGAPSSLAVDLANRFGITLAGFLRDERFNVYSHSERIRAGRVAGLKSGAD